MRIPQGARVRGRLIWLAAALAVTGCGGKNGAESPAASAAPRVTCASPAVAEIVFALGCGDRVVGVSEFTDWPPEAAQKPQIGGALAPNRERILALAPSLILAQGRSEVLESFANAQQIGFKSLPLDTLADLRAMIIGFAAALGVADRGRELLAKIDADFAAISVCTNTPVFIALGHAPGDLSGLMTSGPGTFLSEIVAQAGGSNIFSDAQLLWPKISQETLVRRQPTLILDFQTASMDAARQAALIADWEKLGFQAGRVRILEEDFLLKPGPRAAQAAARIAAALCGGK